MSDKNCGCKVRCEPCRTINLAMHAKSEKPSMEVPTKCFKCVPTPRDCVRVQQMPVTPICIKVCDKEEYNLRRGATKIIVPKVPVGHGKFMYAVKAGILVGAVYLTYTEGIWGDQAEVSEAIRRWQEYVRSINSRRPPVFDACGKVQHVESTDSIFAPVYAIYKNVVTTCFSGIVKLPVILKCMYIDYMKALERKQMELAQERKLKRNA